ncbi:hypothetical protein [Bittarella massiliensis (ex Durand et al. 2017)]|uniref:hypothetical protein n=1 Tax=Bittarella massiliensis (ex Durand et al. 2017) TaxID=1720313 RepID=UPI001AA194F3|nr:hypothetical protein [Bittarella massiliensis (ex Durand et al. 2017)]MBO1680425.1 hypothetical protein [Bittarella massiliensis (ex Durand et al. 2017)]
MKKFVSFLMAFLLVTALSSSAFAYYFTGRSSDWNDGYKTGYDNGEAWGYNEGRSDGYSEGYTDGYDKGKEIGVSLKEELQGANSQLRIYKNATVGLGFLSAALVLGAAGYYFFVIKKKNPPVAKVAAEPPTTSLDSLRPAPTEPVVPDVIKPARVVKVHVKKKEPAPTAPSTQSTVSTVPPEPKPELATVLPVTAEAKPSKKPKAAKPDPSEEVHKRARDLGLGMKWFDFLRGHFWGPALVFFAANRLATSSISRVLLPIAIGGNLVASVAPLGLIIIEAILYVNFFNSLVSCDFNFPSKWAYFCAYSMVTAIVGLLFSLASFFYIDFIYYLLFFSWFTPNIIYLGKRKKLF